MKKLLAGMGIMMMVVLFSSILWLNCFACSNYVSDEDYGRMAQELVNQSGRDNFCGRCGDTNVLRVYLE